VIFHTKYPKTFHASLRNMNKMWFFGVKSWFFTRNTPKNFAPPSARRIFFREMFWGISCEKSRFYAKNHVFSNFRGSAPLDPPLETVVLFLWFLNLIDKLLKLICFIQQVVFNDCGIKKKPHLWHTYLYNFSHTFCILVFFYCYDHLTVIF
jgi:hypothetical protein